MPVHRPIPPLEDTPFTLSHPRCSSNSIYNPVLFAPISPTAYSNFDRLPVELQVEIFTHYLPPFPPLSDEESPSLLLKVCKSWRALVLSTPRLWSSFEIEVKGSPVDTYIHDLNTTVALGVWLKRSRTYPLSFRVIHHPTGKSPDVRSVKLLEVLVLHACRWNQVHIVVPSTSLAAVQSSLPRQFPELRTLTLQMNGSWEHEGPINVLSLNIPWSQLTTLDLQPDYDHLITLDELLWILCNATNLISCTMGADCSLSAEARKNDRIWKPRLESLNLIFQGGLTSSNGEAREQHMVDFLALLNLTSIRKLQIEWLVQWNSGLDSWSPIHQSQFVSFLQNIGNTVETLGLAYVPLGKADVLNCIANVPSVKHFELKCSLSEEEHDPVTDSFFRALTIKPSAQDDHSSQTLPLLQDLLLMCHGGSYHPDTLLEMLQSRKASGEPLKKVHLVTIASMSDELNEGLRDLKKHGLDATIDTIIIR